MGQGHPLFDARTASHVVEAGRAPFAGGGITANMELSHRARLSRKATGFDQEAIATLILSGAPGFLPDHYAQVFEQRGLMKAVLPARFNYACRS